MFVRKNRPWRWAVPWLLLAAVVAGCGGAPGPAGPAPVSPAPAPDPLLSAPAPDPLPPPAQELDPRLVRAQADFGLNLLRGLQARQPGQNVFISPASVGLALAMTYNGARGETQEGMARALSVAGVAPGEVNQAAAALFTIMANPDPQVQVRVANSIWYQQEFRVQPAFLEVVRTHYQAAVEPVDFASPAAAAAINRWISDHTEGYIPAMIDQTHPLDRMYLVNAIYFNGQWQEPFNPALTRPRPFHLAGGSAPDVPMMTRSDQFRYLRGEGFQAVALPYGQGRLSLYAFVPEADLEAFVSGLSPDRWQEWFGQFARREGTVTLPRVKLEYDAELSDVLAAMGMGRAFTPDADFGNLFVDSRERLFIAFVLHKTFLDLNERGTEAAAATAVAVPAAGAPLAPEDRFELVADRPYLLAIRDDTTGAILFLGAITDPRQES